MASGVVPHITGSWAMRGRRCILAGDYRFHLHGDDEQLHVHHRTDVIKTVTTKRDQGSFGRRRNPPGKPACAYTANTEKDWSDDPRADWFSSGNNQEDPPFRPSNDDPLRRDKAIEISFPIIPPPLRYEGAHTRRR